MGIGTPELLIFGAIIGIVVLSFTCPAKNSQQTGRVRSEQGRFSPADIGKLLVY